jgi:hypothetical protein
MWGTDMVLTAFPIATAKVYRTVASLLSSTETTRGLGAIWEAGGFRYEEVSSGDDVITAGGVKLKVLPNPGETWNPGTVSLPSVRAEGDENTGLNLLGSDQLQLVTGGVARLLVTASAATLNLPLGGTAVTQSATDTTAGRLLKVGDAGILGLAPQVNTSNALDDLVPGCTFVRVTTANVATVNGPTGANGGVVQQLYFGSSNIAQIYTEVSGSPRQWIRRFASSAWSAWQQIHSTGTMVGTVSESSGVPTGAIIERGSNANGNYTRFADGTQLCWINSFTTASSAAATWTFPAAFTTPTTNIAVVATNLEATLRHFSATATATTSANIRSWDNAGSEAVTPACRLIAIGRWF